MDEVDTQINKAFFKFWHPFRRDILGYYYTEEEEIIAKCAFIAGIQHMLEVLNETERLNKEHKPDDR